MKLGDVFLCGIVLLQLAAAVAYLAQNHQREALMWVFAALSNFAYLSMARG
jgi:hypothetical protein